MAIGKAMPQFRKSGDMASIDVASHAAKLTQLLIHVVNTHSGAERRSATSRVRDLVPGGSLYDYKQGPASDVGPASFEEFWHDGSELTRLIEERDALEETIEREFAVGVSAARRLELLKQREALEAREATLTALAFERGRSISLDRGQEILDWAARLLDDGDDADPAGGHGAS